MLRVLWLRRAAADRIAEGDAPSHDSGRRTTLF
jgi:hypothetical protein